MTTLFTLYSGAIILGAFHAFEPGHGKTLIAAYMVGTRGRAWDGVLLGTIVTITHTFSVILLGLVAMLLSKTYSDEVLHNWLGLFSAALILIVGIWMLRQRLSGSGHGHIHLFGSGHDHHHPHNEHSHEHHHPHEHPHVHRDGNEHDHQHETPPPHEHVHEHQHPHVHPHEHEGEGSGYHEHPHPHEHHDPAPAAPNHHDHNDHGKSAPKSKWELLLLGMSGGLIPCPAAIATLLAAIAAGKIAQGLSVTLFFSLGLGGVMITIGVLLSQSRHLTGKISDNLDIARKLSIASAVLIIVLGSYTMFHSVKNIWF
ncbi:MAG: nickel/cobalt exporter [Candidatus Electronema aureum]|uniref:Nickel/cobalt efflux system n=1 Tax=Candidatus Electronema aureum TaxID=2005002 RepID=A0A521G2W7_9BACT|nr:MAG: nickel/cobalt exporter [Candidatus Electronema aureum]